MSAVRSSTDILLVSPALPTDRVPRHADASLTWEWKTRAAVSRPGRLSYDPGCWPSPCGSTLDTLTWRPTSSRARVPVTPTAFAIGPSTMLQCSTGEGFYPYGVRDLGGVG